MDSHRVLKQSKGQMYVTGRRPSGAWVIGMSGSRASFGKRRIYVQFDLSAIPTCGDIETATLEATLQKVGKPNSPSYPVSIHKVTADWATASRSWGTPGPASFSVSGKSAPGDAKCRQSFWSFCTRSFSSSNLLQDVNLWRQSPASNQGWVLIGDEATAENVQKFEANSFVLKLTYKKPPSTTTTTKPDPCEERSCDPKSKCIVTDGKASCTPCPEGYTGDPEISCQGG